MERAHWQDAVAFLVGLGLLVVVFVINIPPQEDVSLNVANWNFILIGMAIVAIAGSAIYAYRQWEEWVLLLLGIWLAISPWALGYASVQSYATTALTSGLIVATLAGVTVLWTGGAPQK